MSGGQKILISALCILNCESKFFQNDFHWKTERKPFHLHYNDVAKNSSLKYLYFAKKDHTTKVYMTDVNCLTDSSILVSHRQFKYILSLSLSFFKEIVPSNLFEIMSKTQRNPYTYRSWKPHICTWSNEQHVLMIFIMEIYKIPTALWMDFPVFEYFGNFNFSSFVKI